LASSSGMYVSKVFVNGERDITVLRGHICCKVLIVENAY